MSSLDPRRSHASTRAALRFIGPLLAGVGAIFVAIGLISFFTAFGSFQSPRYFWCVFVGGPLLAIGLTITKAGFMGSISRYFANEMAPVSKDTFNYMASGTRGSIRDVASAIGEGLHSGINAQESAEGIRCDNCDELNESTANFCKNCGDPIAKNRECSHCGEVNDPDARFCDNCGQTIE